MNDIRRTFLWVIFGFSMVLLWDQWQIYNGHKATFFPSPAQVASQATGQSSASAINTPASAANPNAMNGTAAGVPTPIQPSVSNGVMAPPVTANTSNQESVSRKKEIVQITTDVLKVDVDTEGGSVVRLEFLKHVDITRPGQNVILLDNSTERIYMAQTGLISSVPGINFPTHKTPMTPRPGLRALKGDAKTLSLVLESAPQNGLQLIKTYTFKAGSYAIDVVHDIVNTSSQDIPAQLYFQLVRDGNKLAGESAFYSTFTGPAIYTEAKKYQKVEFADVKKKNMDIEKQSSTGYVAMVQHYFASAWVLPDGLMRNISMDAVDIGERMADCCYRATLIAPLEPIAAGKSKSVSATLFAGPQEEHELEAVYPGLELVKDYGWLTILAKPLYWLLHKLNNLLDNWGWSIVALVVLIKAAFYWLNAHAYKSMAKMKAINPKIMDMRERLKDNPQQMQVEMMKIYREEKVNPLGGCLPIAIQIPVFIALYWVLLSTVEMRNAPWVLWIHDLAAPDTSLGVWFGVPVGILPIVMTLTTVLQTALNPAPPDPMQAKLMWIMPLAFSVMFFFFPSGLVLYWITNNVLSIAQQWVINTRMGVPPQFNLPKF
jgi:YidC/Oxa1 family membrane protein insertase